MGSLDAAKGRTLGHIGAKAIRHRHTIAIKDGERIASLLTTMMVLAAILDRPDQIGFSVTTA